MTRPARGGGAGDAGGIFTTGTTAVRVGVINTDDATSQNGFPVPGETFARYSPVVGGTHAPRGVD